MWLMNDIERAIGKEPTQREVKEQLAEAVGRNGTAGSFRRIKHN
jgi:hypothetical protein